MTSLAALFAALALLAPPHQHHATASQAVHSWRAAITWHRGRTWYWQDRANVARTPTAYFERHTRSIAALRWDNRLWEHRQKHARHRALTHPPIGHLALWSCIHSHEAGSWNNADTGHNGHYGGLQMTSPWGRGVYYVYRADWLTSYQQMRKAELGYAASGYSHSWLLSQWYHPDCLVYA